MSELLEVFDLNGKLLRTQGRKEYYANSQKEYLSKGKITTQVKSIRLLLMNSSGRIYLQKRSKLKSDNAGLYDKTIGGHVSAGDSWDTAVIRECAEELGFPSAIVTEKEFMHSVKNIDLSIVGIFRKVDEVSNFPSLRFGKSFFVQPFISSFYIGYYNGALRFADGEASGIEVFSLKELKDEIKSNPAKFTEDLKFIIKKYEKFLVPLR